MSDNCGKISTNLPLVRGKPNPEKMFRNVCEVVGKYPSLYNEIGTP